MIVDILNRRYKDPDEVVIRNYSGEPDDLPERIQEVITYAELKELDAGDWITLIDGEIVEAGEITAHTIQYTRE